MQNFQSLILSIMDFNVILSHLKKFAFIMNVYSLSSLIFPIYSAPNSSGGHQNVCMKTDPLRL